MSISNFVHEGNGSYNLSGSVSEQDIFDMASKISKDKLSKRRIISSASDAGTYVQALMRGNKSEVFAVIFLSTQYSVLGYEEMFQGTINQAPVFPREIARRALELNSQALILIHCHPGGIAEPSVPDRDITEVICNALSTLEIKVIDHFIVTDGEIYSFAEHGLL